MEIVGTLILVGALGLYFILTRMCLFFGYTLISTETNEKQRVENYFLLFLPILGDLAFLLLILFIIFALPPMLTIFAGQSINKFLLEAEARKIKRQEYLDNLAKYGLRPKDIPNYIQNPDDLDRYLQVLKQHEIV